MKDIVNTKIKFREPFRPFAPSVLVRSGERYFDFPTRASTIRRASCSTSYREARAGRVSGDHPRRQHGAAADRHPRNQARSTTG